MSELLVGHKRYAELVRKLLSASGGDVGIGIEEKLQVVLNIPLNDPEHRFLQDEYLVIGTRLSGNTAALFTGIGIQNPANTDVQIVVEDANIALPTADQIIWFKNVTDAENGSQAMTQRDQRLEGIGPQKVPTGRLQEFRSAALGGGGVRVWAGPAATDQQMRRGTGPFPWVLDPGKNLVAYRATANTVLEGSFMSRERPLERYEKRR